MRSRFQVRVCACSLFTYVRAYVFVSYVYIFHVFAVKSPFSFQEITLEKVLMLFWMSATHSNLRSMSWVKLSRRGQAKGRTGKTFVIFMFYRYLCFTGKYTVRKTDTKLHPDPSVIIFIPSVVRISVASFPAIFAVKVASERCPHSKTENYAAAWRYGLFFYSW